MKLQKYACVRKEDGKEVPDGHGYFFFCPGCKEQHAFWVGRSGKSPSWDFDGNMESPTFHPSLLMYTLTLKPGVEHGKAKFPDDYDRSTRCHLFLKAGRLEFCVDSPHHLAGKVVDLPDLGES